MTIIATESDLRAAVALDLDLVDRIAGGFGALSDGNVVMPAVMHMDLPFINAEVDAKAAYIRGIDGFAVKVSPGFFDNPNRGLRSTSGFVGLLDAKTGRVRAVMLDDGYLTEIRTAAAGAVAARALAIAGAQVAGVIGTGTQARLQLHALALVRPIREILVWGRDQAKAQKLAAIVGRELGIAARSVPTAEQVVTQSAVVVTTTPSREGIVEVGWLHPGLHITALGSDAPGKRELRPGVVDAADVLVCDRRSQAITAGELQAVMPSTVERAVELGDVLTGRVAGRITDAQISICDLTGTGVQDTVIALLAEARLSALGRGVRLPEASSG